MAMRNHDETTLKINDWHLSSCLVSFGAHVRAGQMTPLLSSVARRVGLHHTTSAQLRSNQP